MHILTVLFFKNKFMLEKCKTIWFKMSALVQPGNLLLLYKIKNQQHSMYRTG